ncbi:MAG: hypothetical protein M3500_16430, partial [Actinomycetota bacterium]|nr:hypothetical protein [Actinomycetota bacterium]
MPVQVGTSGWQYADWRGGLYPAGLPERLWLEHYSAEFDTVEVGVRVAVGADRPAQLDAADGGGVRPGR